MNKFLKMFLLVVVTVGMVFPAFASSRESLVNKQTWTKGKQLQIATYDDALVASTVDGSSRDGVYVQGACTVYGINVCADTDDDQAFIADGYRGVSQGAATGINLKLEIKVADSKASTYLAFPQGIPFANDVGVDTTDGSVSVTILYTKA